MGRYPPQDVASQDTAERGYRRSGFLCTLFTPRQSEYKEWSRMADFVKTVRCSEEEQGYLEWYQDSLGLNSFSNTFRFLLKWHRDNLTPQQDKSYRLHLREQRKMAQVAKLAVIDPTHCAGCGKGDPWFLWYPQEQEGKCQGCSHITLRNAVA